MRIAATGVFTTLAALLVIIAEHQSGIHLAPGITFILVLAAGFAGYFLADHKITADDAARAAAHKKAITKTVDLRFRTQESLRKIIINERINDLNSKRFLF